jgi:signal peptidase II
MTRFFGRHQAIGLGVALLVLAIDQASKIAVVTYLSGQDEPRVAVAPFFDLTLVANHGVSFGLFSHGQAFGPLIFSAISVIVTIGLIAALSRAHSFRASIPLGFIIGGAIGNLADRIRLGSVVDFLDFFIGNWHWYIFNMADAAICIGVGLLLLDSLLPRAESPKA